MFFKVLKADREINKKVGVHFSSGYFKLIFKCVNLIRPLKMNVGLKTSLKKLIV